MKPGRLVFKIVLFALICSMTMTVSAVDFKEQTFSVKLTVTSPLPFGKVPMDPVIDFTSLIQEPGWIFTPLESLGVLNPNTIQIINVKTGKVVPHALDEDFMFGNKGRVLWVIEDPLHTEYEIRFRTAAKRPSLNPPTYVPMVGTGDLLRYNAGQTRPTTIRYPSNLLDLTGDGKLDLVGFWPHPYAPKKPKGGIFCYPRVGDADKFEFGDIIRIRYRSQIKEREFGHFTGPYLAAEMADLNRDGLVDLLYATTSRAIRFGGAKDIDQYLHIYLNSGDRDDGGMPVFLASARLPLPSNPKGDKGEKWWGPIRVVDLDNDGILDVVIGHMYQDTSWGDGSQVNRTSHFMKNTNPKGWPMELAKPIEINSGRRACYYDIDGDGLLDAVGLSMDPEAETPYREDIITWRKNLGGSTPNFGPSKKIPGIDIRHCQFISAVNTGTERGLLVGQQNLQVAFFEQISSRSDKSKFRRKNPASESSVIVASDQASPYPCDWEGDGDWDLVVGGGHGWPQVIINEGTNLKPAFAKPQKILSAGKPIRIFATDVFPDLKFGHDMGYPFPSYIDWDADGLPDLMVPNITNRVFWYKNIGSRKKPAFGPRQQVIVDGYPETAESLARTAELLKKQKRPPDPTQPFGWRARAGFGDLNGDGLMDIVHADGRTHNASYYADVYCLFVQYRDKEGNLRLRRDRIITLPDGSPMKGPVSITSQSLVVDWDGDGLLDLICHAGLDNTACQPEFLRNIGTKTNPKFDYPKVLSYWGKPLFGLVKHGPYWGVHDLDDDGKVDLLAGCGGGKYVFFRRSALEMKERPKFVLGDVKKSNR